MISKMIFYQKTSNQSFESIYLLKNYYFGGLIDYQKNSKNKSRMTKVFFGEKMEIN